MFSSTSLTVKAALTFKPIFTTAKTEFLYVADSNNLNSGWQIRGTWTPFPASPPTADSISPNSGSGSTQLFQSVYSDASGSSAIACDPNRHPLRPARRAQCEHAGGGGGGDGGAREGDRVPRAEVQPRHVDLRRHPGSLAAARQPRRVGEREAAARRVPDPGPDVDV